jgi:hypothetical protein
VTKADATPLEHSDNKAKGGTFILLRDYLQSKGKQRGNLPTPPPLLMPVVMPSISRASPEEGTSEGILAVAPRGRCKILSIVQLCILRLP